MDDKYTLAFGTAAFFTMLAFTMIFLAGACAGILFGRSLFAEKVVAVGFVGFLGSIPFMLLLILIGEIADECAATNHHRAAQSWERNHRTLTAFMVRGIHLPDEAAA